MKEILSKDEQNIVRWYVLSVPQYSVNLSDKLGKLLFHHNKIYNDNNEIMEYFVPMLVHKVFVDGELTDVSRPFCSYVFIKGSCVNLRFFHNDNPAYNLIPDSSRNAGYIYVGDDEMNYFRYAVHAYNGCAPFISDFPQLLEKGDLVRIIKEGPFYGFEGTLINRKGKDGGRVLIKICDNIAIPTFEIESKFLQPLSYSSSNKHLYRRLDIYYPLIISAIKSYLRFGNLINNNEKNRIHEFVSRYSRLTLDSGKMRGRFLTYMLMSVTALNIDATDIRSDAKAFYARELLDNLRHITNSTTLALAYCALYCATKIMKYLDYAKTLSNTWDKENVTDKQNDVLNFIRWCEGYFE